MPDDRPSSNSCPREFLAAGAVLGHPEAAPLPAFMPNQRQVHHTMFSHCSERTAKRSPARHTCTLKMLAPWLWLALAAWTTEAHAGVGDDLYRARYEVAGSNSRRGTNDITKIDQLFNAAGLAEMLPPEVDIDTDAISASLSIRGVDARVGFEQDSTAFHFQVDAASIDIVFDGGSRDASVEQFERWLSGEQSLPNESTEALTDLLQALVAGSSVEPIAGNPNSLQYRMMQGGYDFAMRSAFRPEDASAPDEAGNAWSGKDIFGLRGAISPFKAGLYHGFSADLAFEYTVNFRNPRVALLFDLPIVYTQTESEANTLAVHAGAGLLYRVTPWWNLAFQGRAGLAGSLELGALAVLYSTNLTSHMEWSSGDTTFRLGNAFSASSTIDGIEWFGVEVTYDVTNFLLRNGFEVDHDLGARAFGRPVFARMSFTDNWVLGSDVFVDHYNELGLHFGTRQSLGSGVSRDRATIGATYAAAPDFHQLRLSLAFGF